MTFLLGFLLGAVASPIALFIWAFWEDLKIAASEFFHRS